MTVDNDLCYDALDRYIQYINNLNQTDKLFEEKLACIDALDFCRQQSYSCGIDIYGKITTKLTKG